MAKAVWINSDAVATVSRPAGLSTTRRSSSMKTMPAAGVSKLLATLWFLRTVTRSPGCSGSSKRVVTAPLMLMRPWRSNCLMRCAAWAAEPPGARGAKALRPWAGEPVPFVRRLCGAWRLLCWQGRWPATWQRKPLRIKVNTTRQDRSIDFSMACTSRTRKDPGSFSSEDSSNVESLAVFVCLPDRRLADSSSRTGEG